MKLYKSAPLPFVGQKRMFATHYIKVLEQYPDSATFVDLFGGSGLLSHITKRIKPNARVIYNDFDNYRQRLTNIPQTNKLLADLRQMVGDSVPRHKPIKGELEERIYERIAEEERQQGYVDYITLSSSLLFSMKYKTDLKGMRKETLWNVIRKTDYPPCDDYLQGLEVVSKDYRELYEEFKDDPSVVFLVDPPYLSTDVCTYEMYWNMTDYLDVLNVLRERPFVYFTSNKSKIIELCDWMGRNRNLGNPFESCEKIEFNASMNYRSTYTDIMLYKALDSAACPNTYKSK